MIASDDLAPSMAEEESLIGSVVANQPVSNAPRASLAAPKPNRRFAFWALLGALAMMAATVLPLWRPLLLAAVFAGALTSWHERLARAVGNRRWLSAGIVTLGVNVLILLPITTLVVMAISQADDVVQSVRTFIDKAQYEPLIERLPQSLQERLKPMIYNLPAKVAVITENGISASMAKQAVGGLTVMGSIVTQFILMLIAFYFLLEEGPRLNAWITNAVPLRPARVRAIAQRFRRTARTVLGANLLTAVAQGGIATAGYFIAGVPQALFFGLLTVFSSFIPGVGTAIVALPLAGFVLLLGHPYAALFLAIWSTVVVGLSDNILRPWLAKGGSKLHGAVVLFSILGSIAFFGTIGLILGPLTLSAFLTMLDLWKRESSGT